MKQLVLIRHSYAEAGNNYGSDFDRDLTDMGMQYAVRQAQKLIGYIPNIDIFISGQANRAKQTTQIFIDTCFKNSNIQFTGFLYHDYTTQKFVDFLKNTDNNNKTIAIVGHNPNLSTVAYRLCNSFNMVLAPCNIVILGFDIDNWEKLQVGGGNLLKII